MKVGIVVPYSWSFWGAVVEHAESQAEALRGLGVETRLIMGNDPPGSFTRVLHPRLGRHGSPPAEVIPVGRSVIVPANGSLPNIVLSPRSVYRIRRVLERERFDLLHLHEPMTPAVCVATLALARTPIVATFHAAGGTLAWPEVHERTGARLRVIGSDPLAVRLLLSRLRVPEDDIDVLGFLSQEKLTEELLASKVLAAPSLRGESFGMVLTRALACATPVVASDIVGYREVMTSETGTLVPPGDPGALADALTRLLEDEQTRSQQGRAARRLAQERYSWDEISRALVRIYDVALGRAREPAAVAG